MLLLLFQVHILRIRLVLLSSFCSFHALRSLPLSFTFRIVVCNYATTAVGVMVIKHRCARSLYIVSTLLFVRSSLLHVVFSRAFKITPTTIPDFSMTIWYIARIVWSVFKGIVLRIASIILVIPLYKLLQIVYIKTFLVSKLRFNYSPIVKKGFKAHKYGTDDRMKMKISWSDLWHKEN